MTPVRANGSSTGVARSRLSEYTDRQIERERERELFARRAAVDDLSVDYPGVGRKEMVRSGAPCNSRISALDIQAGGNAPRTSNNVC